jgi:aerobic-type carbon monoxide dehydrogenase small subunit (CoxS/CutS family)
VIRFVLDGAEVEVPDDGTSLLETLRDRLGRRSVKDGCGPQGQCGCCTVLVDDQPRVACVTATRRVAGRSVTTLAGLDADTRERWLDAFTTAGASQCGFCTPGIVLRLVAHAGRGAPLDEARIGTALAAHLCRCTGWRPIFDAARMASAPVGASPTAPGNGRGAMGDTGSPVGDDRPLVRDEGAAARRAAIEGGAVQMVGPMVAAGDGGFADDLAPDDALVAVLDTGGEWVVAETLAEARARAGKVQGRNSTAPVGWPLEVPRGDWALQLQTTFVEPAYLELDASWCEPGGEPRTPLANGGAFGGKEASPVAAAARRLADEHGRPVRALFSREDVVSFGPKRPPLAAGLRADGSGVVRVARTPRSGPLDQWCLALRRALPDVEVEQVTVPGPPVSAALRGAGWAEGAVLAAVLPTVLRRGRDSAGRLGDLRPEATVVAPGGGRARAVVGDDGSLAVTVDAGEVLDHAVLRSYCTGAAHQALGWVRREGVAVDGDGEVLDLTIRSFGILAAREMPPVAVTVERSDRPATNVSDAVVAAVAAAAWLAAGLPPRWPLEERGRR